MTSQMAYAWHSQIRKTKDHRYLKSNIISKWYITSLVIFNLRHFAWTHCAEISIFRFMTSSKIHDVINKRLKKVLILTSCKKSVILRRDIFYHTLRPNGWTESHQIFTDRVKQCAEYIDCLKIYFNQDFHTFHDIFIF